jgi:O-antigen/teichoic acid export membrane protein
LSFVDNARTAECVPVGDVDTDSEHFRTDHLLSNLPERAVSSGLVTAAAQGAKFFLNLGSAVILARLLSPEEFGLVGMVLAITGLLGLFKEAGLSTATVQSATITQAQVSGLFWINVALGAIVAAFCIFIAPVVAWFYGDPRLTAIMSALSGVFLLSASTVQHQALLIRQMRFRAKAIIEVTSMGAGVVVACVLAFAGYRYWSLVALQLVVAGTTLIMTWWASGWRPSIPARRSGVAPLLRFGAHLTASDLVGRLAASSDNILIGRFFGAASLGLYTRANVLLARPLEQLLSPISAVLIPVLSRLQSDPVRYRLTYLRAYDTLALLTFCFSGMCLGLSEPLVLLLLGDEWSAAVPLFAAFTLVALSLPLSVAVSWLLMSQGRGRDLLDAYLLLSVITVAAFLSGLPWGPLGVVIALAIASLFIRLPILYYLAGQRGPVGARDLWRSFLSHSPCWASAWIAAMLTRTLLAHSGAAFQLAVAVPVGLAAGVAAAFALEQPRASALYAWKAVSRTVLRHRFDFV